MQIQRNENQIPAILTLTQRKTSQESGPRMDYNLTMIVRIRVCMLEDNKNKEKPIISNKAQEKRMNGHYTQLSYSHGRYK